MPYIPNSVTAKDGGGADKQILAQGTGVVGDPFLPLHGDVGVGAIDDAPATSNIGNFTVLALFKRLLNVTLSATVSLLTDMDGAIGDPSDAAATSDTGSFSLISLVKRLLVKTGGAGTAPTDYRSILTKASGPIKTSPGALMSIEVVNFGTATRYFMLYDEAIAASAAPTTSPIRIFPVYAGGFLVMGSAEWGAGLEFTTAIAWGMSTTKPTFTAATASDTAVCARHS